MGSSTSHFNCTSFDPQPTAKAAAQANKEFSFG